MPRLNRKIKIRTTGYFHPVRELLLKANYEILDKISKYAAPPYVIVLLHNAMELMLKDFLLSRNISKITYKEQGKEKTIDVERVGSEKLLEFSVKKIVLIRKNYQKFRAFNTERNTVYHRSSLTLRIENVKDYYRLIMALYNVVYNHKFKPSAPPKIRAYLLLALYSFIFAFGPPPLPTSIIGFWVLGAFCSLFAFSFLSISYFSKQYHLHGYFTF